MISSVNVSKHIIINTQHLKHEEVHDPTHKMYSPVQTYDTRHFIAQMTIMSLLRYMWLERKYYPEL